MIGYEH